MSNPNYYEILGIDRNATKEEIKKAYRKLSLLYHPDKNKNPNAHDRFIEINEAYLLLYDVEARVKYDKEFQSYSPKETVNGTVNSEKPFEDIDLNAWSKSARSQAEQYAKMAYENFYNLLMGVVKETGFQFGNVIIYMISGVLVLGGISSLLRSNFALGLILIGMGVVGQFLVSKRCEEH